MDKVVEDDMADNSKVVEDDMADNSKVVEDDMADNSKVVEDDMADNSKVVEDDMADNSKVVDNIASQKVVGKKIADNLDKNRMVEVCKMDGLYIHNQSHYDDSRSYNYT